METQKRIFSTLSKGNNPKKNILLKKLQLGLLDNLTSLSELQSMYSDTEQIYNNFTTKYDTLVNEIETNYGLIDTISAGSEITDEVLSVLNEVETSASDLGIAPEQILPDFLEYFNLVEKLQQLGNSIEEVKSEYEGVFGSFV